MVLMGMGEPLANLPGILPAVEALTDPMRLAPWQKFWERAVHVTVYVLHHSYIHVCSIYMSVPHVCSIYMCCAYMRGPLVFQSGESLEAEAMSGKKVVVSTVGPSPAQVRALQRLQRALHQIQLAKSRGCCTFAREFEAVNWRGPCTVWMTCFLAG